MIDCPYEPRLTSYYDGELSAAAARALDRHVVGCESCAHQLQGLRELSQLLGPIRPRGEISQIELARVHRTLDRGRAQPLLRLGIGLSAAAASILIISLAWLSVPSTNRGSMARHSEPQPQWERLAMGYDRNLVEPPSPGQETDLADRELIEWMLASSENPKKVVP